MARGTASVSDLVLSINSYLQRGDQVATLAVLRGFRVLPLAVTDVNSGHTHKNFDLKDCCQCLTIFAEAKLRASLFAS
jgi:hypothetical protein